MIIELIRSIVDLINKRSEDNARGIQANLRKLRDVDTLANQASVDAKKANKDLQTFLTSTESEGAVDTVREILDLVDKNDTDILSQVASLAAEVNSTREDIEEARSYVESQIEKIN
jgi:Holliday junction resolvasome RuvABC ATP-dependent DNA helicase subunit